MASSNYKFSGSLNDIKVDIDVKNNDRAYNGYKIIISTDDVMPSYLSILNCIQVNKLLDCFFNNNNVEVEPSNIIKLDHGCFTSDGVIEHHRGNIAIKTSWDVEYDFRNETGWINFDYVRKLINDWMFKPNSELEKYFKKYKENIIYGDIMFEDNEIISFDYNNGVKVNDNMNVFFSDMFGAHFSFPEILIYSELFPTVSDCRNDKNLRNVKNILEYNLLNSKNQNIAVNGGDLNLEESFKNILKSFEKMYMTNHGKYNADRIVSENFSGFGFKPAYADQEFKNVKMEVNIGDRQFNFEGTIDSYDEVFTMEYGCGLSQLEIENINDKIESRRVF